MPVYRYYKPVLAPPECNSEKTHYKFLFKKNKDQKLWISQPNGYFLPCPSCCKHKQIILEPSHTNYGYCSDGCGTYLL